MSDLQSAVPPAAGSAPNSRTWDFMETLFVALLADGAFVLTGSVALMLLLAAYGGTKNLTTAEFQAVWEQGRWQASGIILGTPAAIAVLWAAVRIAGRGFADYLALNWPSRDVVVCGFGVMIILITIEAFVTIKLGLVRPQTSSDLVVGGAAGLLTFAIGMCVGAPVLEEFLFRGFMFRGWSQSFLGPYGAIVLTAALWALNHTQYGWYERSWIFVTGLTLGYFRLRANSTWLTVMLHSGMNMAIVFLGGPYT
ncbi:CPBP family intramembrane metalloprotease [Bradyrhizobium sp. CCGUVB4N]|uniref:CPBP family intramembrane glutamic endopeptidase n=1 Tax=Bradyrhizobium sp. CCGUVB4N TaxID=2949631 RepID=UPI0020B1A87D|nr:CPBP family intramembrane glutamic endopeptidase [Bradyrhizobium sp. CCGUVB4N]MCP3383747.1 CPBP family intramembrane metalloprotease [Bradyrhizobium sp. CCGUVB4N]